LESFPHTRARIFHGDQELGLVGNVLQVGYQVGTYRAFAKMLLLLGISAGINDVWQYALELCARHLFSLPIEKAIAVAPKILPFAILPGTSSWLTPLNA
jgi:hypothetical protein